jgi:Entner-Doudoroff aldolase
MLKNFAILNQLNKTKLIAVIRGKNEENSYKTAKACIDGGVKNIELAFTSPHANETIKRLDQNFNKQKDVIIGAGTVLESVSARIAILAGAKFIVSPSFNVQVAKICNLYSIPYIPGCFSPTEVQTALTAGSNLIKIFPGSISGSKIISELKGPFPQVNIMPSGGVSKENLKDWLDKGAFAVGIGGSLVGPADKNDYDQVTKNAQMLNSELKKYKQGI